MEDKIKEIKEFLKKWNKNNEVFVKDGKVTVGGSLYLSNTNITELPDNLTVGGSLDLRHTNITELPDNLTVNGGIYGFSDDVTNIKQLLKGYNKELKYIYFDGILWGNVKSVKK